MKKYPKIVQMDKRGQIVIPKDIRDELGVDEGTAFWLFSVDDEGIILKKIEASSLKEDENLVAELKEKSESVGITKAAVNKAVERYRKKTSGRLEEI